MTSWRSVLLHSERRTKIWKASDYIVWPSEECKKGAAVVKNDSGTSGSTSDMSGAEGGYEEPVEENAMQEGVPGTEESVDE